MPMPQRFLQKFQPWWQGCSRWERHLLATWTIVAAALALWFGGLAPLFSRVAVLERRIPELEIQLNRMRAPPPAGRAAAVAVPQPSEDLRSVIYGQLAKHKISAELRALSPVRVEMRLSEMPLPEALELLDNLRRQSGARVAVFNVRGTATDGGLVRIVAELERTS